MNLSAHDALDRLMEGNRRFARNGSVHPNQSLQRRAEVAKGQKPYAIVLGCIDSRVPPEVVFDVGLGDIFVVRVAGNIVDDAVMGSVEFGVDQFGIGLVMVLGHERCGAVSAAVEAITTNATLPGKIGTLVEAIRPSVREAAAQRALGRDLPAGFAPGDDDLIDTAVRANARRSKVQLEESEPILSHLVKTGKAEVVAARYGLDSGLVELLT